MTNTEKLLALIANQLQLQNAALLSNKGVDEILAEHKIGLDALMRELTKDGDDNVRH